MSLETVGPVLARAPIVDPRTALASPIWIAWFEELIAPPPADAEIVILTIEEGGTGLGAWEKGDLVYAAESDELAGLTAVARGAILISDGVDTAPKWLAGGAPTGSVLTQTAGGDPAWQPSATPSNHDLLSDVHQDSTAASPVLGDLIVATGSPAAWARLPIGAAGEVLTSDGTTADWAVITHPLLSASHTDTTAGTVSRGDLITGQGATATWDILSLPTLPNSVLMTDGTDVVWSEDSVDTQTTVGAAGAASNLPAKPTGYWQINLGGIEYVIPYYLAL